MNHCNHHTHHPHHDAHHNHDKHVILDNHDIHGNHGNHENHYYPELQKRANRANLLVLIFLAGANVLANNAKNGVHFTDDTGSHHCKLYDLQCVSSTGATGTLLVPPLVAIF